MLKSMLNAIVKKAIGLLTQAIFPLFDTPLFRAIAKHLVRGLKPRKDIPIKVQEHKMYANSLDRIAALCLWKFSALEGFETRILQDIVKKEMVVVDIGANIGYYTLKLAKLVGEKGKVYAFEPAPDNFSLLIKNIKVNNYENVFVVPKAVSNKTGKINLYLCVEHTGDHRIFDSHDGRKSIEIETVALDDFFSNNERIDFIKMDIQGAEYLALTGMKNLIQGNRKLIIISELSPSLLLKCDYSGEEYLNKIIDYGFSIKFINEKKELIESISPEDLLRICSNENYVSLYLER